MVALCDPPGLCEQGDVAEPCHGYHGDYLSVLSQEVFRPWPDSVHQQNLQAPLPLQRVIGLFDIKKDIVQYLIPHSGELLSIMTWFCLASINIITFNMLSYFLRDCVGTKLLLVAENKIIFTIFELNIDIDDIFQDLLRVVICGL